MTPRPCTGCRWSSGRTTPRKREGFVRIINRSDEAGEVRIEAIDDSGRGGGAGDPGHRGPGRR